MRRAGHPTDYIAAMSDVSLKRVRLWCRGIEPDERQHGPPTAPLAGDAAPATEDDENEIVTESMGEETETTR